MTFRSPTLFPDLFPDEGDAKVVTAGGDSFTRKLSVKQWSVDDYKNAALKRAGIKASSWDPSAGLTANMVNVQSVYKYYETIFEAQPDKFLWAGMAKLAGGTVYNGLKEQHNDLEKAQAVVDAWEAVNGVVVPGPGTTPYPTVAAAVAAALKPQETMFLQAHKAIFTDLAWQHEAFLAGGANEIGRLSGPAQLDAPTVAAWRDIGSGDPAKVAAGNKALLFREQNKIIQPYYDQFLTAQGVIIGWLTKSPLPGGKSFSAVEGKSSSIFTFQKRWDWIVTDMLPLWNSMTSKQRQDFAKAPLGSVVK